MMAKRQSPPKERKVARSMYHRDWSVFPMVTVNFAFGRKLTFVGMKRYVTVGQLRELVATELYLPSTYVALANDGAPMLTNAMLLEDIFGAECNVYMVRDPFRPQPAWPLLPHARQMTEAVRERARARSHT